MSSEAELERFGLMVGDLSRLWRGKLDQRLKPLGLSQAKWMVIMHLDRSGGGLVQRELAARVGIEDPSLARLLDRMAAGGWIERRESPEDRRCKTVHLTRKARTAARRIKDVIDALRRELLADLSSDDLAHCARVFEAITRRAETI
ncbi:MAG TPA: MarR family transcriptional regulator [Gammaproteobacteria bacterium]|nr:MarR family transcriptional regulator [Gammaproteobacteria bacterium]